MAKPNYRQQKKSKEQARKVRQAEKQQRRKHRPQDEPEGAARQAPIVEPVTAPAKLT